MNTLSSILSSFAAAFTVTNLLVLIGGTILGIIFGALPGVSSTMGVAVLIPLTYGMNPVTGLIMLAGIYCGSVYGGSISACLLNTPGTPASAATTLDGFPMTRLGRGGEALHEACIASFWGGIFGAIVLLFLAPTIATFSLKFGSQENAMMAIFGLTIIVSLSNGSLLKGFLAGLVGLLLSLVGMDITTAYPRFTFNVTTLLGGIAIIPAIVGLYSMSQLLTSAGEKTGVLVNEDSIKNMKVPKVSIKDFFRYPMTYIKSAIIGAFVGIVPGAGGNIAGYIAYNEAKRASKTPEEFGKGCREGVAATEAANNAVCGGSLIPMLTLGIPGNSVAAVLMGGLLIQGLTPGYSLFSTYGHITYPFLAGFILAQFAFTLVGLIGAKQFAKVVKVPKGFLLAGIGVLCVVGSYAASNNIADVYIMLIFGIFGFLLKTAGFDISAIVLGLMLGSIAEAGFMQSYSLFQRQLWPTLASFFTRPISLILILVSVASCFSPLLTARKAKKKAQKAAAAQQQAAEEQK